jgi:hypothetical protein
VGTLLGQAPVFAKGLNFRESYGSINHPAKQGTAHTIHHLFQGYGGLADRDAFFENNY